MDKSGHTAKNILYHLAKSFSFAADDNIKIRYYAGDDIINIEGNAGEYDYPVDPNVNTYYLFFGEGVNACFEYWGLKRRAAQARNARTTQDRANR